MFSRNLFSKFLLLVLILLSVSSRLIKIDWGDGHFFHPDENNMATALSHLQPNNLNPNFFAYGQFPLYLGYFTLRVLSISNTFSNSIFVLRVWSGIFSLMSIPFFYLVISKVFSQRVAIIGLILYIFNPGLIQLSHFGTTESLLILTFLLNIYLALKAYDQPSKLSPYVLTAVSCGIGLASKISALIFILPIMLATAMNFTSSSKKLHLIPKILVLLSLTATITLLLSPYNWLSGHDFLSSLNYETGVATGHIKVFYTTQFQHSVPYLFQLLKVFPYVSGIPQYFLFLVGVILILNNFQLFNGKHKQIWTVILVPAIIYFLYFGQLYVKWTRFVSPIFFTIPLLTTYTISKIKSIYIQCLVVFVCCFPGIYFLNLYFHPDIRVTGSEWFDEHVPPQSKILSESGNVINFPITNSHFSITNFDFYALDNNLQFPIDLVNHINQTDYIVVPSRRVFMNQANSTFTYSSNYYRHLFNGSLGFTEIKQFYPSTDFILNPENAEETWSVFDRPTIRVFQKTKQLGWDEYRLLIIPTL